MPRERARVYPFGVLWFWKCSAPRPHGGRSRSLSGAYDAAVAHLCAEHGPRLTVRKTRRGGQARWFLMLESRTAHPLGYIDRVAQVGYRPSAWMYDTEPRRLDVLPLTHSHAAAASSILRVNGLMIGHGWAWDGTGRQPVTIMEGRPGGTGAGANNMGTLHEGAQKEPQSNDTHTF